MTPVTLLTGFLGAGKTTLLNRLLTAEGAPPTAVVVNEFGDIGIDGALVVGAEDRVIELRNGCICCEIRADLQGAFDALRAAKARWWRPARFERIVVETSGLASPGPVVATLGLAPDLRLAGIVCLVDAANIRRQLADHPEVPAQLAAADRVLLNHIDRATEPTDDLLAWVRLAAPLARCIATLRAEVPGDFLSDGEPLHVPAPLSHAHTHGVQTWSFATEAAMDLPKLKMFLQFVAARPRTQLLRLKGIVRCRDHPAPVVAHGIHQWLELGPGPGQPPARSTVVLIGRGFDGPTLQRAWDVASG